MGAMIWEYVALEQLAQLTFPELVLAFRGKNHSHSPKVLTTGMFQASMWPSVKVDVRTGFIQHL